MLCRRCRKISEWSCTSQTLRDSATRRLPNSWAPPSGRSGVDCTGAGVLCAACLPSTGASGATRVPRHASQKTRGGERGGGGKKGEEVRKNDRIGLQEGSGGARRVPPPRAV